VRASTSLWSPARTKSWQSTLGPGPHPKPFAIITKDKFYLGLKSCYGGLLRLPPLRRPHLFHSYPSPAGHPTKGSWLWPHILGIQVPQATAQECGRVLQDIQVQTSLTCTAKPGLEPPKLTFLFPPPLLPSLYSTAVRRGWKGRDLSSGVGQATRVVSTYPGCPNLAQSPELWERALCSPAPCKFITQSSHCSAALRSKPQFHLDSEA
jgi:hypothetical protein